MTSCSWKGCKEKAVMQIRINKMLRPVCFKHFAKIKSKRIQGNISNFKQSKLACDTLKEEEK